MKAKFYFSNDNTIESDIIVDSFTYSEIYYNKLQAADGSLSFTVPYSVEITNALNADLNNNVKVEIKNNDGTTNYATGYIKQDIDFEQKYRNQPIKINVVNASYLLDQTIEASYALENKTVTYILTWLLQQADFEDVGTLNLDTVIPLFIINSGDNIKDVIKELCFEYSKTFYFDNDGYFQVFDIFDEWQSNSQVFNANNINGSVTINAKEHDYDCVRGKWTPVQLESDTLVFKDTQGATDEHDCQIAIESHKYYNNKQHCFLDCDSTLGEVVYVKNITQKNIEADTGITWTADLEDRDSLDQIRFSALNENETTNYINKMELYADAYVSTGEQTEVTSYGKKEKEIELKYIQDETIAQTFVKNLADYYNYANYTITLKSEENWSIGSFAQVVAEGIGTFNVRILKKTRTLKSDLISYECENIGSYTPAEIVKTTGTSGVKNMAGTNQGTAGANGYNCFMVQLFKRYTSAPAVPSDDLVFDFTTGELTGETNGWSRSIPEIDEDNNPCFEIHYNISTVALTKTIGPNDWSEPMQVLKDSNLTLADVQELISQSAPPPTVYINPNFAGFAVDSKSIATVDQEVECEVKVLQSGEDMPFTFGDVSVPSGFSYTVDGSKITFSVAAGTVVKYGSITIPVIFKAYKSTVAYQNGNDYLYISAGTILGDYDDVEDVEALTPNEDEIINWTGDTTAASETVVDGGTFKENTAYYYSEGIWKIFDFSPYGFFTYEDEDTTYNVGLGFTQVKGGRYLGTIESASDIPTDAILGDYFTFTGDTTSSYYKSRVYIYDGSQWEEDTNTEHNGTAFYDVLSAADEELATNNSTVNEMLNHLTANEIFAKRLVANTAFVETLNADTAVIDNIESHSVQTDQLIISNIPGLRDELDAKAGKAVAIVSQKQVYYLTNGSAPAKPTSEVTSTSTAANVWTTKVPDLIDGYNYYSCAQNELADSSFSWGTVAIDTVLNSEIAAYKSASSASSSATTASSAASNAKTSEENAKTSETNASASSASAGSSASAASASASNAKTSETNAKTSETNAKTSETNAGTSEDNAAVSEQNAKASETNAGTSATNAGTSATNAAASEKNASESEKNAKSSETNAGISEENAALSESNAADSEEKAKSYKESAETSATTCTEKAAVAVKASTNTIVSTQLLYYRATSTSTPPAPVHSSVKSTDESDCWTTTFPSYVEDCFYWTCTEYTKHNYETDVDYYVYGDAGINNDITKMYAMTEGETIIKGGYIDTDLIKANSIDAEKIDVTDLLATDITVKDKLTSEAVDDDGNPVFEIDGVNGDATFNKGTFNNITSDGGKFTNIEASGTIKGDNGYFTGVLGNTLIITDNLSPDMTYELFKNESEKKTIIKYDIFLETEIGAVAVYQDLFKLCEITIETGYEVLNDTSTYTVSYYGTINEDFISLIKTSETISYLGKIYEKLSIKLNMNSTYWIKKMIIHKNIFYLEES